MPALYAHPISILISWISPLQDKVSKKFCYEIRKVNSFILPKSKNFFSSLKALWSFETPETTNPARKHHIPEEFHLRKNRCKGLSAAFIYLLVTYGARGGAVGWGTALQARRSWVRFPMVSLDFFIDIILPALGSTQPLTEMSTRNVSWG